ncbi:Uncharacterised protein [Stenotrophomonas maltophilia]|nr:hypothetical protein A1OC_02096 [Stenotrophomonas maltophilia Ab55555]SQG67255.1 Uncharacterised protein [Stenotrophomonas maltophilia]
MARHMSGNCAWSYSFAAPVALIGLNPSRARPSALIESGATLSLRQQVRGRYNPANDTPLLRFGFDMRNRGVESWLQSNSSRLISGVVEDATATRR